MNFKKIFNLLFVLLITVTFIQCGGNMATESSSNGIATLDPDNNANESSNDDCDEDDYDCAEGVKDDDDDDEENTNCTLYYDDYDGDSYGDPNTELAYCDDDTYSLTPEDYVTNDEDCDDNDSNSYPGATDFVGDDVDQDCSGTALYVTEQTVHTYKGEYNTDGANSLKSLRHIVFINGEGDIDYYDESDDGDEDYNLKGTYTHSVDGSETYKELKVTAVSDDSCISQQYIRKDEYGFLLYWFRDNESDCGGYEHITKYTNTINDNYIYSLYSYEVEEKIISTYDEGERDEYTLNYSYANDYSSLTINKITDIDTEDEETNKYYYYEYNDNGHKTMFKSDADDDGTYDQHYSYSYDDNGFLTQSSFYNEYTDVGDGIISHSAEAIKVIDYTNDEFGTPTKIVTTINGNVTSTEVYSEVTYSE
jgi:hypothetical protein